jgi:Flp pilus assembly pilin Flp
MDIIVLMRALLQDRKGISSLEYVVLAVGVLTGLIAGVAALTTAIKPFFSSSIPNLL